MPGQRWGKRKSLYWAENSRALAGVATSLEAQHWATPVMPPGSSMSLVRLNDVSVVFDTTPVLREAFFRLEAGDRVGLIGKNGSGKSTLLKLVLDQLEPTTGTVSVQDDVKIGYFSQFSELDGSVSVMEVLSEVFAEVREVEAELALIDTAMAAQDTGEAEMDRLVERQAELFEAMARLDGWDVDREIDTALTKLGFSQAHRTCPIDALSGGWRNRASLAKILLEKPDVLLFDEPTNYLDVVGVEWVESWFRSFHGAAIVVSHDRAFLDDIVNRIVEVENHHLHEYSGNFGSYVVEKQLRLRLCKSSSYLSRSCWPTRPRASPAGEKRPETRARGWASVCPGSARARAPSPSTRSSRRSTRACTPKTCSARFGT